MRKFARDGPGSRLIVSEGVGRILVLVEPDVVGVISDQLLDQTNPRIQVTAVLVTLIDHEQLRAKGVNQLAVRRGNIRVDYANELVTLGGANHGQRNAQIPRRGFDKAGLVVDQSADFKISDQRVRGLQLDGAGRIQSFDFQLDRCAAKIADLDITVFIDELLDHTSSVSLFCRAHGGRQHSSWNV